MKFRKPNESIHKAARLKNTVSSNLPPSRSIPFLFYLSDPPPRLLSDDLSTSIWFVRLICFAREVRRKEGEGETREEKTEDRSTGQKRNPVDGNAELHAKRIAKRGKVQFAVPRISDEVCQLHGKKEPSQAKKLTSH